jgi:hypothetical protein
VKGPGTDQIHAFLTWMSEEKAVGRLPANVARDAKLIFIALTTRCR